MNKRKMRVLLVSAKVRAGGEAAHVTALAKEFIKKGIDVSLLSTDPTGGMMAGIIPEDKLFFTEFRNHNPLQTAMNPKQPYVYTCHSMSVQTDFMHRMLNSTGDAAIAVSGDTKEFMIRELKIPEEKITVIENGVDPTQLRKLTEGEKRWLYTNYLIPEGKIVAAIHGRIDPRKNHIMIGKALANLPEDERSKFVILCSGIREVPGYDPLVSQLRELGVLQQFRFTGWTEPRNILGCADLLLGPSQTESFMMSALEGFFMDIPVIRSKTGGYSEMKDLCIGIDADDLKGWTEILHRVAVRGTDDMKPMVDTAHSEALRRFTSEAMAAKVYRVYREVLRGRGR